MAATHRRLAITLLLVVGALLLVAVGSSWLIVRVWGPSLTASRIAAAITEATGQPSHVDHVTLEPLRGRVQISGLTVGGQREDMIRVERIDVGIRLESLWRLELVVGIAVHGANVRLQADPTAPPPPPFEMPERFELGPITVRLASIRVEQSQLRYEDPAKGLTLGLDGLGAEGRPDRGGLELTARAEAVHLHVANFTEKLERLSAEGRIDAARILARRLDVNDGRHEIKVTGAIESPWSKDPTLSGEAKARLALGPLAQSLGAAVPVDGTAAVDLTLGGALASPVVAGRVSVERLDVAGVEARDLSASLRLDDQALAVADVAGRMLGGQLHASLTMPAGRPNDTLVRFRLDDADAGALARLRGGTLDVRGRLALDGEARGDLARPLALSGQLRVDGSELSLPGALARLGAGRLRASARMAGGQIVSDAEGRWPSASLTASARVEPDQRLRVEARATTDLSALPGWGTGRLDRRDRPRGRALAAGDPHGRTSISRAPLPGATPAASISASTRWPERLRAGRARCAPGASRFHGPGSRISRAHWRCRPRPWRSHGSPGAWRAFPWRVPAAGRGAGSAMPGSSPARPRSPGFPAFPPTSRWTAPPGCRSR